MKNFKILTEKIIILTFSLLVFGCFIALAFNIITKGIKPF